jgi:Tfp pilus assembly protein FimT
MTKKDKIEILITIVLIAILVVFSLRMVNKISQSRRSRTTVSRSLNR